MPARAPEPKIIAYATLSTNRYSSGVFTAPATIYQSGTFGTQAFNGQLNFPGTVACRQLKVMRSLEIIETDYLCTTQAFKVSVLLGIFMNVGTKTPDSIRTHQPMHKTFLIQPLQHTIERDPIKSVFALQSMPLQKFEFSPIAFRQMLGELPVP